MIESALVLSAVFLTAGFTHGITGFGVGIVVVALLGLLLPIQQAAAMAALAALTTGVVVLIVYRDSFDIRPVSRLLIGAFVGIPLGIYGIQQIPASLALTLLGLLIVAFSLFSLFQPEIPKLSGRRLTYGFGFVSGMFAGAFNAGGPIAIVYGLSQGWDHRQFKGNITGYMMSTMVVLIVLHLGYGSIGKEELAAFSLASIPLVAAVLFGLYAAERINPAVLRRVMLIALLLIGVRYSASFLEFL